MKTTRRRFIALLPGAPALLVRFTNLVGVAFGSVTTAVAGMRSLFRGRTSYQIVTNVGNLTLTLSATIPVGRFRGPKTFRAAVLTVPTDLLINLASGRPTGGGLVDLESVAVTLDGTARVSEMPDGSGEIRIGEDEELLVCFRPDKLFPVLSIESPISLRPTHGGRDGELTIRLKRLFPKFAIASGTTEWRPLKVEAMLWESTKHVRRTLAEIEFKAGTFASPSLITPPVVDCSLTDKPPDQPQPTTVMVNGLTAATTVSRESGYLLYHRDKDLDRVSASVPADNTLEIRWRPGQLILAFAPKAMTLDGGGHEVTLEGWLYEIVRTEIGSVRPLPLGVARDGGGSIPPDSTVSLLRTGGSSPVPWLLAPRLKWNGRQEHLQFTFAPASSQLCGLDVVHLDAGDVPRVLRQDFAELEQTIVGGLPGFTLTSADAGSLRTSVHVTCIDACLEVAADESGTLRFVTGNLKSGRPVSIGDFAAITDQVRQFHLKWTNGIYVTDVCALLTAKQLSWAGRFDESATRPGGWVHVKPLESLTPGSHNHRGGPIPISGSGGASALDMKWTLTGPDPYTPGDSTVELRATFKGQADGTRLESLSEDAFRAQIDAVVPRPADVTLSLAPFTLREHPDTTASWIDTTKPAFHDQRQWEPASTTRVSQPPEVSVNELFDAIGTNADGVCPIEVFNAGIRMRGFLRPLIGDWAPDKAVAGMAPYRRIDVETVLGTEAVDLVEINPAPDEATVKSAVDSGLRPNQNFLASIEAAFHRHDAPVALAPVGGSIDFDWKYERPAVGLVALGLHSYLARYQRNTTETNFLQLPWGLKVQVLTYLFRGDDGEIAYEKQWEFISREQQYGADNCIRLYNLIPLNPTTWLGNVPMRFKADIDIRQSDSVLTLAGVELNGTPTADPKVEHVTERVVFEHSPAFAAPITLFDDKVTRLHAISWTAPSPPLPGTTVVPSSQNPVGIKVSAEGELWQSQADVHYDDPAIIHDFFRYAELTTAVWNEQLATQTAFKGQYADVGTGLVRVHAPLPVDPTFNRETSAQSQTIVNAVYSTSQKIKLSDIDFLQLFMPERPDSDDPAGQAAYDNCTGTLTLTYTYIHDSDKPNNAPPQFKTSLVFPDLTGLTPEICAVPVGNLMRLRMHAKSFEAKYGYNVQDQGVRLTADIGIPGFVVLRDTTFVLKQGATLPTVEYGHLELCPGLLEQLIKPLFDGIASWLGETSFKINLTLKGFDLTWSLGAPDIPFGGGSFKNLVFDLRIGFQFEFASSPNTGFFAVVMLGRCQLPRLDIDWLNLEIGDIGMALMRFTQNLSLTITPFTVQFSAAIGSRVKFKAIHLPQLDMFICMAGAAGLAVEFDVGIASGGASIAIGVRYCPYGTWTPGKPPVFVVDEISIGVMIDAHVSVAKIISISLHAEIFATLRLHCRPPSNVKNIVFSGYASIQILFATLEFHFTVDLDGVLGLPKDCTPLLSASAEAVDLAALWERTTACVDEHCASRLEAA